MKKLIALQLLALALLLSACGQAAAPAVSPQMPGGQLFMLALPRIEITFDRAGNPSILGFNPASLGFDLGGLKLDKSQVDQFVASNVQHIQLRMVGDGVLLYVNGKPMPGLAFDDLSLQKGADFAAAFGVKNVATIKQLLPVARRLGLDIVLRFPRQAGAVEIPLAGPAQAPATAAPAGGAPWAILIAEIAFDEAGQPGLLGVTAQELAQLGIQLPAALSRAQIEAFKAANIQYIELRGKPAGLFIYVNGEPLPNLHWDSRSMTNAAEFYAQIAPESPYAELIKMLAPMLPNADIDLILRFPLAAGRERIPIKTH